MHKLLTIFATLIATSQLSLAYSQMIGVKAIATLKGKKNLFTAEGRTPKNTICKINLLSEAGGQLQINVTEGNAGQIRVPLTLDKKYNVTYDKVNDSQRGVTTEQFVLGLNKSITIATYNNPTVLALVLVDGDREIQCNVRYTLAL